MKNICFCFDVLFCLMFCRPKVAVLLFHAATGQFERVHTETYGKTGLRRTVPGAWLAADPRGRAFMIGAVKHTKREKKN